MCSLTLFGAADLLLARRLGNLEAREIAEELSADNDTHDLWLGRACHLVPLSLFLLFAHKGRSYTNQQRIRVFLVCDSVSPF